jgi:outer membrane protein assembly factor BamA
VVIDPDRRLIEETRADNARPPSPQIVLDTAEVEITSTEFGFSGLVVGRGRYDYRKDLAVAGFYTNRSLGFDAGARYHWGAPNDPTLYRHNLYAFYGVQALDRSFKDERRPQVRTSGHANNVGLRYDYNNVFAYDNPTEAVRVRLFADWYDGALGSDYDYLDWGGSLVLTHPLWTHRTILAAEVLNGFSEPLGSSRVPNQGLYSLGGSRSIRGIGAEDELGRNIVLLRGELRQAVYPEVDLNFLDLLVLRRAQVRFFVDTGQVENAAGRVYDPAGYAVGVGVGLAAVYDFLGFFPSVAYIEIATRADRDPSDVQFLFGTRQAF